MRDLLLCIRADEAIHREVNHELSQLPYDAVLSREEIPVTGIPKEEAK